MTIKSHIAISATISLALIAIIACQQKPQASKEQSKAMTEQKTKVEEVMKNFEQEAKDETEKLETKVEQAAKEVFEEVKKSAKYGYENIKEGKFNNDLQGWLAYKDTPADNFNAVKEDISAVKAYKDVSKVLFFILRSSCVRDIGIDVNVRIERIYVALLCITVVFKNAVGKLKAFGLQYKISNVGINSRNKAIHGDGTAQKNSQISA